MCSRWWRKTDNFFLDIISLNVEVEEPMFRTVLNKLDLARRAGFEEFHIVSLTRNTIPEHEVIIPLRRHPDALMILWESDRPLFGAQLPLSYYVRRLNFSIPTLLYANVEASEELCKSPEYATVIKHGVLEFAATLFRASKISDQMYRITLSHDAKLKSKSFKRALTWMSSEARRRHKAGLRAKDIECVRDPASVDEETATQSGDNIAETATTKPKPSANSNIGSEFHANNDDAVKKSRVIMRDVPTVMLTASESAEAVAASSPNTAKSTSGKVSKSSSKITVKQVSLQLTPAPSQVSMLAGVAAAVGLIPLRPSLSADDKSRVLAVQQSASQVRQIANAVRMADSVIAKQKAEQQAVLEDGTPAVEPTLSLEDTLNLEELMQSTMTDLLDAELVLGKRVEWYFKAHQQPPPQTPPLLKVTPAENSISTQNQRASSSSSITEGGTDGGGEKLQQRLSSIRDVPPPRRSSMINSSATGTALRASVLSSNAVRRASATSNMLPQRNLYRHQQQQRPPPSKLVYEVYSFPLIDGNSEFKFTYRLREPMTPETVLKIFDRVREYKAKKWDHSVYTAPKH